MLQRHSKRQRGFLPRSHVSSGSGWMRLLTFLILLLDVLPAKGGAFLLQRPSRHHQQSYVDYKARPRKWIAAPIDDIYYYPFDRVQSSRLHASGSWSEQLKEVLLKFVGQQQVEERVAVHVETTNKDPDRNTQELSTSKTATNSSGTILRLAAKQYDKDLSAPSSRAYTTRKPECETLTVLKTGVVGDYNHYRTRALQGTKDRALSLLTEDVMIATRSKFPEQKEGIQNGDFGENILVGSIPFSFFRIGEQYRLGGNNVDDSGVVIQVTEPMEPCANLCTLPYINDFTLEPKERINRCQDLLAHLGCHDGYRGWYAKVLEEGTLDSGAAVHKIT